MEVTCFGHLTNNTLTLIEDLLIIQYLVRTTQSVSIILLLRVRLEDLNG